MYYEVASVKSGPSPYGNHRVKLTEHCREWTRAARSKMKVLCPKQGRDGCGPSRKMPTWVPTGAGLIIDPYCNFFWGRQGGLKKNATL